MYKWLGNDASGEGGPIKRYVPVIRRTSLMILIIPYIYKQNDGNQVHVHAYPFYKESN